MGRHAFEYSLLRVIPRIDRGESINAGVILYCQASGFLGIRLHLDADRLAALDPSTSAEDVQAALDSVVAIGAGEGPSATESIGQRFRWLTAPRSTVVQPGPIHTGLTADPAAELDRLLGKLVRRPEVGR
jgi:hypothetical protein